MGKRFRHICVSVPGRLNCLIKDPIALVKRETTGQFNYGEISLGVDLMTHAEADSIEGNELIVGSSVRRPGLVRHFAEIVRKSINYRGGVHVEASNDFPYSHTGSGSSAALATAIALAINKLAGEPIKTEALPLFLAQNYGEEIEDNPNFPKPDSRGGQWQGKLKLFFNTSWILLSTCNLFLLKDFRKFGKQWRQEILKL